MLKFLQLFIAVLVIIFIVPQTPTENKVLRLFLETGFFMDYSEAKWFLNVFTWFLISSFLLITFLIAIFF